MQHYVFTQTGVPYLDDWHIDKYEIMSMKLHKYFHNFSYFIKASIQPVSISHIHWTKLLQCTLPSVSLIAWEPWTISQQTYIPLESPRSCLSNGSWIFQIGWLVAVLLINYWNCYKHCNSFALHCTRNNERTQGNETWPNVPGGWGSTPRGVATPRLITGNVRCPSCPPSRAWAWWRGCR